MIVAGNVGQTLSLLLHVVCWKYERGEREKRNIIGSRGEGRGGGGGGGSGREEGLGSEGE